MLSRLRLSEGRTVAALLVGIVLGVFAAPIWRMALVHLNQQKYGELTYLCDSAMRAHDLARARAAASPSGNSVELMRSAEIGLIDCQDYDLFQKRLMMLGLRESELGLMRLKAIEENADGLRQVVEAHEIRH